MQNRNNRGLLSASEEKTLIRLLKKVRFPIPPSLFDAWCDAFTVNPVELLITRGSGKKREIFLVYRDDRYWKGWHVPGSILRPNEKITDVIVRLKKQEIGFPISSPQFLRWEERTTPRGKELALIFSSKPRGKTMPAHGTFFSLVHLPKNIIPEHRALVKGA